MSARSRNVPATDAAFRRLESALLRLHAANDTPALWSALIHLLGRAYPHHSIVAGLRILNYGPSVMLASRPMPLRTPEWLEENYVEHPGFAWLKDHPGAKLVSVTDVLPVPELKRHDYYRLYMQPEGWLYGLAFIFWRDQWLDSFIAVNREESQGDFTPEERVLSERLYPQIGTALRRVAANQGEREAREALARHLHDLPLPSARVDWSLRVVYANRAAAESVERWEALRSGHLRARRNARTRALRLPREILAACLEVKREYQALARVNTPLPTPAPRAVLHPDDPTCLARVRPLNFVNDPLHRPSFWIHWESPHLGGSGPLDPHLALLRGLSPREREVTRLVCQGRSNREIAADMGTARRTIESQLRSIFTKLNVRRRTELIAAFQAPPAPNPAHPPAGIPG